MLTCSCLFVTSNQAGSREPKFQIFFHRKRGSLRSTFGRVIAKSQASYTVSQILSINHITSNLSFHDSKTTTTPPQILLILTLTSISIPSRHPHHLSLPIPHDRLGTRSTTSVPPHLHTYYYCTSRSLNTVESKKAHIADPFPPLFQCVLMWGLD